MTQHMTQPAEPAGAAQEGVSSPIDVLLQQTPYPKVSSNQLLQLITVHCLFNAYTYGRDPQRDQAVAKAFERLTHVPFEPEFVEGFKEKGITPSILFGPPGHGKSSLVKAAAQKAAELLGMRFVEDFKIPKDQLPGPNDYLFITRELAGQNTLETGEPFMDILPERAFVMARNAGACVLLLDDVANAYQALIPALLGIVKRRCYGQHYLGLRTLPVLTANFLDGSADVIRLLINHVACYTVVDE